MLQREGASSSAPPSASGGSCSVGQSVLASSLGAFPAGLHGFSLLPAVSATLNLQQKTLKSQTLHPQTKLYAHSSSLREPGSGKLDLPSCLGTGHLPMKRSWVHADSNNGPSFQKTVWDADRRGVPTLTATAPASQLSRTIKKYTPSYRMTRQVPQTLGTRRNHHSCGPHVQLSFLWVCFIVCCNNEKN